ncbi:MAG: thioredoxin [Actinobacteria bacterium]|nr:thioredoxin [Actinomycetota bacterium]MCA1806550.1 thioredoxin [Actinomycetota bacterium]
MVELTKDNFEEEVLKSSVPVLVDFWAPWCAPCIAVAPVLESLSEKYKGEVDIKKLNVDKEGELAALYGISAIPTMIAFKGGEEVSTSMGALPAEKIEEIIKSIKE